jgi:hypothetical protein
MQCWQDIAQFQQFLQCMLTQMGPIALQGVTDGSVAKAGVIGEFVQASLLVPYAAYPTVTNTVASIAVLQPGDWDTRISCAVSTAIGGLSFNLSPQPPGLSNDMVGLTGVSGSTENPIVIGQTASGSFSVPTLFAWHVSVDQSSTSTLLAGNANMMFEARRVR